MSDAKKIKELESELAKALKREEKLEEERDAARESLVTAMREIEAFRRQRRRLLSILDKISEYVESNAPLGEYIDPKPVLDELKRMERS